MPFTTRKEAAYLLAVTTVRSGEKEDYPAARDSGEDQDGKRHLPGAVHLRGLVGVVRGRQPGADVEELVEGPLIFPWPCRLKRKTRLKETHMARLIYSAIMSLDGYTADEEGRFEWAAPDEEVHAFVNELERPVGTYLLGRRMYETMRYWETAHTIAGQPPVALDFARLWQAADKIVYSATLQAPATARTRVERDFDPDQVRKLKEAADRDLTVGGPQLAAQAIAAGLVDEYQLFVVPAVVGGGTRALPSKVRLNLALTQEHRFGGGVVYLSYRPA
jgi:dihydrofolate reductase